MAGLDRLNNIYIMAHSFIIESASTIISPVVGFTIGSIVYLPTILSYNTSWQD